MTNQDKNRDLNQGQRQQEQGMPNKDQHGTRQPGQPAQPSRQQEQGDSPRKQPGEQDRRDQQR